jgi:hypothetical protein
MVMAKAKTLNTIMQARKRKLLVADVLVNLLVPQERKRNAGVQGVALSN